MDGDGIRYAVFLCGCPLRCVYCHNPDTWCAPPAYLYTPERLCEKLKRYEPYFRHGGGVTFSGGEPLLQARFIAACKPILERYGISYALDTSGQVDYRDSAVGEALDGAELVILDLKFPSELQYEEYTGGSLRKTLEFLREAERRGKRVWIRTVVVPGINDTEEAIEQYAEAVKKFTCIEKYELLAFHTMGFDKYKRLGIVNPLDGYPDADQDRVSRLQSLLDRLRHKKENEV